MPGGPELTRMKRAPTLLIRSLFSLNIRYNETGTEMCVMRKKYRGRKRENKDAMQGYT